MTEILLTEDCKRMKIFNICNGCYNEGWGYQENLLPEYEVKAGYDTYVFASRNHFPTYIDDEEKATIIGRGNSYSFNGVHIYRYNTYFHTPGVVFFTSHLLRTLLKEKPDIIFQHGIHFSLLKSVLFKLMYKKTIIFVDSHTDYINQSRKVVWNFILRKILLGGVVLLSSLFVKKFYGVSPGRCDYLNKVYPIQLSKISLLPIGFDVDLIKEINDSNFRERYNINNDAFILCMGGKLEERKGTINLIKSYQKLREYVPNLILVVFGKILDEATKCAIADDKTIINVGWCDRNETIRVLKQSQIAIWPIHHTTLIEDAVGCATPIIVRKTGNTQHLVENNGILITEGNEHELAESIKTIYDKYGVFKAGALQIQNKYSYHAIVRQIVEDCQKDDKR